MIATGPPRNDERRREPARHHQKLAAIEYRFLSLLSNLTGAVFWWLEQKKWRLADQIEQQQETVR
jgi:hypothetical protein